MLESGKQNLSDADFNKLASFIYTNYGIKLPITKKIMLESRLKPRLRANNIVSFKEYCQFILSGTCGESEIINMIDLVSTNKTDFYRESAHFDFMTDIILPEYFENNSEKPFKVWSSASSSLERVDVIPLAQKKKYLLRGKDLENPTVRIVPELRSKTFFKRLNLMDNSYDVPNDFDLIFCRNVLIYFDRETQENVINKLCNQLKKGGYFFLGHSESISGYNVPLKQIKPTMFQKI